MYTASRLRGRLNQRVHHHQWGSHQEQCAPQLRRHQESHHQNGPPSIWVLLVIQGYEHTGETKIKMHFKEEKHYG